MRLLSLHHLTMLGANPLELVEAAAAGGFDCCGLRLVEPTATDSVAGFVNDAGMVRQIDLRLRQTGVRLLDIEAIWLQPGTHVPALLPALEVGRQLGARHVLVVGNDPERDRLLRNFSALCEAAARLQMDVELEFITYCSIGTLEQARSLLDESRQPNAGLLLDALQFFRSGASCAELDTVDPSLLRYMQICDGPLEGPTLLEDRRREARTARLLPGQGGLAIADLIKATPKDIPLSLEAPTLALAPLPFNEQARIAGDVTRRFLRAIGE